MRAGLPGSGERREAMLERRFGDDWRRYQKVTRRWL